MARDHLDPTVTIERPGAGPTISSSRLVLRPWSPDDAEAALRVYGEDAVARWLAPAMERVPSLPAMRALLEDWIEEVASLESPQGRWAVELADSGEVVGGVALLPLPPDGEDLELAWQLAPSVWGRGLAAEAGHAVAHHAFGFGVEELFAVVGDRNTRGAATAQRVGMEWVGETDKYYDLRLQVYRLRKGDLDAELDPVSG